MGRDDGWPATVPTVAPSLRYRKRLGNAQNGIVVLPIVNLMADSESGSLDSYLSFLVTIRLSRLVLEIFVCDGRTTRTITIAGPHIVAGQLIIKSRSDASASVYCIQPRDMDYLIANSFST